jgi:SAM-dependent methyltransferase
MALTERARVPREALGIMTARTLENSHPCLLEHLRPGLSVLDVGCGPGTVTAEIARRAAPGHVVGMDVNPEMIAAAEESSPPGEIPGLVFYAADILESGWDAEFDLVNAARVLQWIPDAGAAVRAMARAVKPGGLVVVLDYDHTRARWSGPPGAWTRFYRAFLDWRAAGGLDSAVVERAPSLCAAAGLEGARVTALPRTVRAGEPDFLRVAGLWRLVADSRGRQMVAAVARGEGERREAVEAFTAWMQEEDATQTTHEACIVARRPR